MKDVITKMWEEYHGPIIDEWDNEEYIPMTPPIYMRGFTDGYEHAKSLFNSSKSSKDHDPNPEKYNRNNNDLN